MKELQELTIKCTNDGILLGIKESKKYLMKMFDVFKQKSGVTELNKEAIAFILDEMYKLHEDKFN